MPATVAPRKLRVTVEDEPGEDRGVQVRAGERVAPPSAGPQHLAGDERAHDRDRHEREPASEGLGEVDARDDCDRDEAHGEVEHRHADDDDPDGCAAHAHSSRHTTAATAGGDASTRSPGASSESSALPTERQRRESEQRSLRPRMPITTWRQSSASATKQRGEHRGHREADAPPRRVADPASRRARRSACREPTRPGDRADADHRRGRRESLAVVGDVDGERLVGERERERGLRRRSGASRRYGDMVEANRT